MTKRPPTSGATKAAKEGFVVNRSPAFNNPYLLGFEHIERLLEQTASADAYPPYNIEQLGPEKLRITIAVAGFRAEDLSITVADNQLVIRGKQNETAEKRFLHKGIAARQFQRSFVLAEGMEVSGAALNHGLLAIDMERQKPTSVVRKIAIRSDAVQPDGGTYNNNNKKE
jgi:HSP20 family molecular chaperone IbpA